MSTDIKIFNNTLALCLTFKQLTTHKHETYETFNHTYIIIIIIIYMIYNRRHTVMNIILYVRCDGRYENCLWFDVLIISLTYICFLFCFVIFSRPIYRGTNQPICKLLLSTRWLMCSFFILSTLVSWAYRIYNIIV